MWAACFGSAVALTWYLVRHKQFSALRVAVFTGLGGAFGFAFGNVLQVLGNVTDIKFNFWNVMEYSLGFLVGWAWLMARLLHGGRKAMQKNPN
ncbi:MAG: hypothetical protein R2822_06575 [Spirosomataceae bacterium]